MVERRGGGHLRSPVCSPLVVHDAARALKASTDISSRASARWTHWRPAEWKRFLYAAEQNRLRCAPTFLAAKGLPHQGSLSNAGWQE